ncbi:Mg transporter [Lanmaoa asiatica]|nr:Mg transporter [Lanmaoa asiatica]
MNGPAQDRPPPLPSKDPFVIDEDIELGDLHSTTEPLSLENGHVEKYEDDLGGDDLDNADDGDTALLGAEGRTRGMERLDTSGWRQVSSIVLESAPTLLLTTVSLLFTGELLDHVSRWKAMRTIGELIMIVPVIMNLKGNLEMNLSARLGTAANMGELDDPKRRRKIILGNLALLQVQATVVACVSASVAVLLAFFVPNPPPPTPSGDPGLNNAMLLAVRAARPLPINTGLPKSGLIEFVMVAASSMLSACVASVILGSFMCFLVVLCRRYSRDPGSCHRCSLSSQSDRASSDNIAPPVASFLGDLVTLSLIGAISSVLINCVNTVLPLIIAILLVCSAVACAVVVRGNSMVKDLIWQGWTPLFGAMVISCGTGIVLDTFASRYPGFPLLAVVISGLPGSVGSIFISRLSTSLHAAASNISHFRDTGPSLRLVMLTLILVTVPIEIIFLAILHNFGWIKLPILFAIFSLAFFCCAVWISLVVAQSLTHFLWSKGLDPDMHALPIHSALMDLIGQLLLVLCFVLVSFIGVTL